MSTEPISNQTYEVGSMLVNGDEVYEVEALNVHYDGDCKVITPPKDGFHTGVAYLYGDHFYLYRGDAKSLFDNLFDFNIMFDKGYVGCPGLYQIPLDGMKFTFSPSKDDKDDWIERFYVEDKPNENYILIHPNAINEEHYRYEGKIKTLDPDQIVEALNQTKEVIQITVPGSNKIFLPEISTDDDLLKRAIKEVLLRKNIDIDQYRYRFTDKNALFNLKQVIKGDAKLSILLFNRACDALNLKYVISIQDADPDNPIGPNMEPVEVSNLDTYDL